jgi:hypothetical protein
MPRTIGSRNMISKFRYSPRLTSGGFEFDPLIPVVFTNPKNGWDVEIWCLVDSGSSATILDGTLAEKLHVDLFSGKERLIRIIQETPIIGYSHELLMRLKNDHHECRIDCIFVPNLRMDGLLGQKGFFDNYRVVFEGYNQHLEVTPIENFQL